VIAVTIEEAVKANIPRVRLPSWPNENAYMLLDLRSGSRGPWLHLFDRLEQTKTGVATPQSILVVSNLHYLAHDNRWEEYKGPLDIEDVLGTSPIGTAHLRKRAQNVIEREIVKSMDEEEMLQYFTYRHLHEDLQQISQPFCQLAHALCERLPFHPERTAMLRKLLEAKDCAVRLKLTVMRKQGAVS
jgi:hypothetical protein